MIDQNHEAVRTAVLRAIPFRGIQPLVEFVEAERHRQNAQDRTLSGLDGARRGEDEELLLGLARKDLGPPRLGTGRWLRLALGALPAVEPVAVGKELADDRIGRSAGPHMGIPAGDEPTEQVLATNLCAELIG